MELIIEMIGGNCPLQAEGTICGKPFYFRARGEHWSMGIGGDPVSTPEWGCECSWGTWPDAGWMPEDEARRLIAWCAAEYAAYVERVFAVPIDAALSGSTLGPHSASLAPDLDPAGICDAANQERLPEPKFGA